jgi:hypothetical protein
MKPRAARRALAQLTAAELGAVRGGISILLPALGKARDPAASTGATLEEITIVCEELVRIS